LVDVGVRIPDVLVMYQGAAISQESAHRKRPIKSRVFEGLSMVPSIAGATYSQHVQLLTENSGLS